MTHAAAALTPQDDTLTTPALLTILALAGLALVVWLIHKIRRTGRVIAESSAVTTRHTERPENDGGWPWSCNAGCGAAVLLDHTTGRPETCGPCGRVLADCEAELGGAA